MEITREVREYAEGLSDNERAALYPVEAKAGMDEMSEKFKKLGGEIYLKS
jgi:phosphomethylpyrimidine synthase